MDERLMTKKMLSVLRESKDASAMEKINELKSDDASDIRDNFLTEAKILMEEAIENKKKIYEGNENIDDTHAQYFVIKKNIPQFGDVRSTQEEAIRKTLNDNIKFSEDALKYYPKADDITLNGEVPMLSLSFQFRFSDPSGDGVYIWTNGLQLTETNARLIGKIRDAFSNWRDSIIQDGDLMEKLKKAAERND